MATTTIPWGDGSGDNIYLTYSASQGDQTVLVSSDANAGSTDRTKTITFTASHHGTTDTKTLTVVQEGVPEPYIVFADPSVEAICATKWGDGVGITATQAAAVTNAQFGTTFNGKTGITTFEEFSYFTGVTTLAAGAFSGSSLQRIALPSTCLTINRAFQNCSALTYLDLPDGVTILYNQTFRNTTTLQEVTFRGTYSPGVNGFSGCSNLKRANIASVDVWAGNSSLFQAGTIGINSTALHLYLIGGNTEITEPVISGTVSAVGAWTFFCCIGLTKVTMNTGVASIGNAAFMNCTGLTLVDIPSSVTSIGAQAFMYAGATNNKCTYIVRATTPPTLANTNAFTGNRINKIYVPNGTLSAYQTASNWSNFASYMAELDANGNIPT